jgi:hypothetical protein
VRGNAPFQQSDLAELDVLLDEAVSVVPMRQIVGGQKWPRVIGMRHDVDNAIEPAVEFAKWEAERGYHSTYFVLHTAPYWRDKRLLVRSLETIANLGHEIGIHNNALSSAMLSGRDPRMILAAAIQELRDYGFEIRGTVAHGDQLCYDRSGKVRFVNDEMFFECPRPSIGEPKRQVGAIYLNPVPLADFDLDYDANWVGSRVYLSDSGGRWSDPGFESIAEGFPFDQQLHMLVHPDWWPEAFATREVAA